MHARAAAPRRRAAPALRPLVATRGADPILIGSVATLVALGLVMVYSASSATAYAAFHDSAHFLKRQAMYLVAGLVLAYAAYRVDYRKLKAVAPGLVVTGVVLLVLTLIPHVGYVEGGARRWLGFHGVTFQPSEFAKLALVVFLAAKLAKMDVTLRSLTNGVFPAMIVALALAVPILVEPDMGTASLLVFTAFGMLYVAGARWEHLAMTALVMLPAAVVAVASSAYKRARVFAFMDPWKDPQNAGFHITQSLLAIGSGGVFGLGLGQSRQKYFYLPEAHTDFIYAVIGEELGLLGAAATVALFCLFALRAMTLARKAPDRFGLLLASGCTLLIVIQAFINMAVVTGSWPVTGVPLPFISAGGTSLMISLIAVGLIANVGRFAQR